MVSNKRGDALCGVSTIIKSYKDQESYLNIFCKVLTVSIYRLGGGGLAVRNTNGYQLARTMLAGFMRQFYYKNSIL